MDLEPRTLEQVREDFPTLRQSLLASMDSCPLATKFQLEGYPQTGKEAARGIVAHQFFEKYINTLLAVGEQKMPAQEAMEILLEAEAQADVSDDEFVHVPMSERETLRIAALKFCQQALSTDRVIAVEKRLFAKVLYAEKDGTIVERTVTGKPDVLIADPANIGVIVPDWKTTRSPPPRQADRAENPDAQDPLSPEGYFQQRLYGLLCFRSWPGLQTVTLREFYPLAGEARSAMIHRHEMEHIEREVALTVQELDRALKGGSDSALWQPQPGRHCRYCPRPNECPIGLEDRKPPAPLSLEQAREFAGVYCVTDRRRSVALAALKEAFEEHGPIPVAADKGDYEFRWSVSDNGRRRFGMFPREAA